MCRGFQMKRLIDRFGVTPVLVGLFLLLSLFMLARCEAGWYLEEQHDSTAGISSSNPDWIESARGTCLLVAPDFTPARWWQLVATLTKARQRLDSLNLLLHVGALKYA